jgi:serine/threonine-protein kinase RsbW
MPQPSGRVLQIRNELSEVERANEELRALWQEQKLPGNYEVPVTMCLEEVLSNVIRHGCQPGRDYDIRVSFGVVEGDPAGIDIEVTDNGMPFDPLQLPDPDFTVPLEARRAGGMGAYLVRKMMDAVYYEYREGRNHFRFRKEWQAA